MQGELLIETFALALGQSDGFLLLPLRELTLEVGVDGAGVDVINSIQQRSKDAESVRDKTTDFA